ncbi:MAG TPA: FAD-dependent oxidoreductase [Polyangiaceae bacterium]|nr:FAD-dependent oxidoreductase [Polyangiaceae bacterium]
MMPKRSPWQSPEAGALAATRALNSDLSVDVCVVGAGMAGLLCALELRERGRSVLVLERDSVAAGETGATTAHLSTLLDTRYFELCDMHGADKARAIATSHMRGIAHLERVANAHGIDCAFQRVSGFLCADDERQAADLRREAAAATQAGISCELVRRAPLAIADGSALHVPHQAQFEPLAFLRGVVRALQASGVPIYAPVSVCDFEIRSEREPIALSTSDGRRVVANFVVVATNSPINDVTVLHTKLAAYRSYGLSVAIPETIPALCWDLATPYHYARTAFDALTHEPLLIVGGEDHRVGQELESEQHWQQLEDWVRDRFPSAGRVVSHWSGQVLETSDGLAFIGRNPGQEQVLVLTGFSGNGMSYSGLGAELIADLIVGDDNPARELYEPARKPHSLGAVGRYVRENLNTLEQYSDWLGPADVERIEDIRRGEGAVLRRGLDRVAVYVDQEGGAHELSATCPHLGGVVAWNDAEKSWDCPCHGSRFDCYGKVIAGPAVSDLNQLAGGSKKAAEAR